MSDVEPIEANAPAEPAALVLAFPKSGALPLDRVAGLPLVLRAVLTLQKVGVLRILVVTSAALRDEVARACADPRVTSAMTILAEATEEDAERTAAKLLGTTYIRARHHVIADPDAYRALLNSPPGVHDVDSESFWSVDVCSAAGRREAARRLFEACRKPVDGLVSRHLNRHVSIFISKRLVETSVTPNAVSVINFALGAVAAASAARGGYFSMLAGAALFQFNSILDGVDGELARVRHQGSKLGEWLDTVSDNACNVMFYVGLGFAAHVTALHGIAWMGFTAAALGTLTSLLYYAELVRLGAGDFYALAVQAPAPGLIGNVEAFFRLILKKDFFILLFTVMAALGVLPWAGPIALLGTSITAVNAVIRTIRWLGTRRAASG